MGSNALPSPMSQDDEQTSSQKKQNDSEIKSTPSPTSLDVNDASLPKRPTNPKPYQRVRRACDRCRFKKTKVRARPIAARWLNHTWMVNTDRYVLKCNGCLPCQRCKAEDNVCTIDFERRKGRRQSSYIELLENTQVTLIATLQKLYAMVRNHETWDLGEPNLGVTGMPMAHDIAHKLNCLSPGGDLSLVTISPKPSNSVHVSTSNRERKQQRKAGRRSRMDAAIGAKRLRDFQDRSVFKNNPFDIENPLESLVAQSSYVNNLTSQNTYSINTKSWELQDVNMFPSDLTNLDDSCTTWNPEYGTALPSPIFSATDLEIMTGLS